MLQLLPNALLDKVLDDVPNGKARVRSACKALRPTHKHPTHAEQDKMRAECGLLQDMDVPYDDPSLLTLFRAWDAPHTKKALIYWVQNQMIEIDEGGLFAHVPPGCTLYHTRGLECERIRVQLWDRVNRLLTTARHSYGWRLVSGLESRAYYFKSCAMERCD